MAAERVTGHLKTVQRREGPVFYIKSRVPGREPRQTTTRLGPKWTEKGRPRAGYYTEKMARDARRGGTASRKDIRGCVRRARALLP